MEKEQWKRTTGKEQRVKEIASGDLNAICN
jgi:hypothetical protein